MAVFNIAYTAPINPKGATPLLTQSQVWAGLARKVRRAHEFVPVITSCTVKSESPDPHGNLVITRVATFAESVHGTTKEVEVEEVCVLREPCRVDFGQPDGTTIYNTISRGAEGELYLSYCFEWRVEGVEGGSVQEEEVGEKYWGLARMGVDSTIEKIRKLVTEGGIQ